MRTELEMMNLINGIAEADDRIRAVYMNGSRTNPNVKKDIFQDYDIVFVVKDIGSFLADGSWIHRFGRILIAQEPDKGRDQDEWDWYGYLMLLEDGNRIDLHLETIAHAEANYGQDSLTLPILDKDGILPTIPESADTDYHIQKPDREEFYLCCNDFWWCQQNVAKAIWRDQLPYAKFMMEEIIRSRLNQMVSWWIGFDMGFDLSVGKAGSEFKRLLPDPYWNLYAATYADDSYPDIWAALFTMGDLFRFLGLEVSGAGGYDYPDGEDEAMTNYLLHVKQMPAHAKAVFDL
ncbi:aminoglycoside 6-adenylyltransferase [Halobacillus sp. BAB-2008]|uniref:aminoglycoside 6-adenylyltransferase n=1 Tax=Halobacillus sp. BAB-2008 TaxID=1246484 RepID=UPI0002A50294|nr:aminoglycoside 6-adenylyltransferase [Halobacillus sp. BAB-2008]ELK45446.1 adenylyltransferase [Halobacillus sp. BAB-2008]